MARRQALAPPRDLTIPEPGSITLRDVLSRALARLLAELPRLVRAHASHSSADALLWVLAALDKSGAGAILATLRRPHTGALLRVLRTVAPGAGRDLANELVAILGFELALCGALPSEIVLRDLPLRIVSLGQRLVLDLRGIRALSLGPGKVTLHGDGTDVALDLSEPLRHSRVTRPFVPIDGDMVLALADNNPLALIEAHPDKGGNRISLGGGHTEADWVGALRASLALVREHLPTFGDEMSLLVSEVIPVGFDGERHESASYREAIGAVYMTLHPSLLTMTEALIHEFQHNKLNALFEVDPVLNNAFEPLYPSPVRPDPRPLHGVLLALHAFLPVALLYKRMLVAHDPRAENEAFRARFEQVVQNNLEAASVVLEHANPTDVGRGLLDELARWDRVLGEAG
jgi:HEXXH motif-containing protein